MAVARNMDENSLENDILKILIQLIRVGMLIRATFPIKICCADFGLTIDGFFLLKIVFGTFVCVCVCVLNRFRLPQDSKKKFLESNLVIQKG